MDSLLPSLSSWNVTTPSLIFCLILRSRHELSLGKAALCRCEEDRVINSKRQLEMNTGPFAHVLCSRAVRREWHPQDGSLPAPHFGRLLTEGLAVRWRTTVSNPHLSFHTWAPHLAIRTCVFSSPSWQWVQVCFEWFSFPRRGSFSRGDFSTADLASERIGHVLPGLADQDSQTSGLRFTPVPAPEPGGSMRTHFQWDWAALGLFWSLSTVGLLPLPGRSTTAATGSAHRVKTCPRGTEQSQQVY